MKKLLIFDFDGTLVDTITDVALCFNRALEFYGFPTHRTEDYPRFVGGDLETVVSRLLPEDRRTDTVVAEVGALYRRLYISSDKPNTAPYPGIKELLKRLGEKGVYVGISTNKSQQLTDVLAKELFADDCFCGVVGYDALHPSKPHPYSVERLAEKCGAQATDILYIGDGRTDIETARNAGVDCVVAAWGQCAADVLADEYPVGVANSPEDIEKYM